MPESSQPRETPEPLSAPGYVSSTDKRINALKRRLIREATLAISMLENALAALWTLDADGAMKVRLTDDSVDAEEVAIEQQCYELLALCGPFAKDFRVVTFVLRVNADIERVADHASSVAKVTRRIAGVTPPGVTPTWPTALRELGERVPALCHSLLRAVLDEDVEAARKIVDSDKVIDGLEKRLFEEAMDMMRAGHHGDMDLATGMLVYRCGRELERVADLMASIAEDLVYLGTGEIIRHQKRRSKAERAATPPQA